MLFGELIQYAVTCKLPQREISCHFKWEFSYLKGAVWIKISFITLRNLQSLFFCSLLARLCKEEIHVQKNRLQTMCGIRCFGKSIFMPQGVSMCTYICVSVCLWACDSVSIFSYLITLQSYF